MTHPEHPVTRARSLSGLLLGLAVASVGVLHFVTPAFFERIVPRELPRPDLLVAASGLAEIGLGLAFCVPRARPVVRWGLVALFLAVFPANVNMLVRHAEVAPELPVWALAARLPLQALLVWWAIAAGRPAPATSSSA